MFWCLQKPKDAPPDKQRAEEPRFLFALRKNRRFSSCCSLGVSRIYLKADTTSEMYAIHHLRHLSIHSWRKGTKNSDPQSNSWFQNGSGDILKYKGWYTTWHHTSLYNLELSVPAKLARMQVSKTPRTPLASSFSRRLRRERRTLCTRAQS